MSLEELVWMVYNCIRNVESAFRCIKSDLNLRPIYHKTDEATEARLHLGLLAYWVVNTIRHKLKSSGINSSCAGSQSDYAHTEMCDHYGGQHQGASDSHPPMYRAYA